MTDRRGERIGWLGGWLGGFVWVGILSAVFLFRGLTGEGLSGLALVLAAVGSIFIFTPWRFARTPYWKLMLVIYGWFILAVGWAVWSFGGARASGLNWWNLLVLLPVMTPLGILGGRKWTDGETAGSPNQDQPGKS